MNELMLPNANEMQALQTVAKNAAVCGLYSGVGNESKIFMILLAARELGIPPMQALNRGINVIQGNVELSSRLMAAMIRRAGHSITVKECNNKICILEGKRSDNGDSFTCQFSMEDAAKAGLANKDNWKKYTEDMLYARAMSRLGRRLFADVIGTCYVEGEIAGAVEEKPPVIEAEIEIKDIQESDEEKARIFEDFAKTFHEEDSKLIIEYLCKYAAYWKKSAAQTVEDYADEEKFKNDFMKWKAKNYPTSNAQS